MAAERRIRSTGDLIREGRWSERLRVTLLTQVLRASVRRHRSYLGRRIERALIRRFLRLTTGAWQYGRPKRVTRFAVPSREPCPGMETRERSQGGTGTSCGVDGVSGTGFESRRAESTPAESSAQRTKRNGPGTTPRPCGSCRSFRAAGPGVQVGLPAAGAARHHSLASRIDVRRRSASVSREKASRP
jgi:hypothetical protein